MWDLHHKSHQTYTTDPFGITNKKPIHNLLVSKDIFIDQRISNFLFKILIKREIEGVIIKIQSKNLGKTNSISYYVRKFTKKVKKNRKHEKHIS